MLMNARTGNRQPGIRQGIFIIVFLLPVLICFSVFYLYPILMVIISSFAKWDYTNLNDMQIYPLSQLFDNYIYIFTKYPYFKEALKNSCIWALCGLLVQVPIAAGAALVISKKCRGWKLARNIYVIPNIISSAAMGLIFLQIYNPKYGVVNQIIKLFNPSFQENILVMPGWNMVALTCAYIFFAGTNMIMVLGQISAIPAEIREAALLDGAKGWRLDRYITLPLIKSTLKTISILSVSAGFILYNEVFFLTNGAAGTKSISFIIRELAVVSPRAQYARANAVGTIQIAGGLLLVLIINLIFRDRKEERRR